MSIKLRQDAHLLIIMKQYVKTYLYSSNVTILLFLNMTFKCS